MPDRKAFVLVERAMVRLEKTTEPATWRPTLLIFLRDRYFLVGSSQGAYVPRIEVPKVVRPVPPKFDEVEV